MIAAVLTVIPETYEGLGDLASDLMGSCFAWSISDPTLQGVFWAQAAGTLLPHLETKEHPWQTEAAEIFVGEKDYREYLPGDTDA